MAKPIQGDSSLIIKLATQKKLWRHVQLLLVNYQKLKTTKCIGATHQPQHFLSHH